MSGKVSGEADGGDDDAATEKKRAELFHGATYAFLRGVLGRTQSGADVAQAFVFEITQEDRGAIGFVE